MEKMSNINPFPKRQNLDSSKLKEFTDDNLKLAKNGSKISKLVENTGKRGLLIMIWEISPFPTIFSNDLYCRHIKTRACLGKSLCQREIIFQCLISSGERRHLQNTNHQTALDQKGDITQEKGDHYFPFIHNVCTILQTKLTI